MGVCGVYPLGSLPPLGSQFSGAGLDRRLSTVRTQPSDSLCRHLEPDACVLPLCSSYYFQVGQGVPSGCLHHQIPTLVPSAEISRGVCHSRNDGSHGSLDTFLLVETSPESQAAGEEHGRNQEEAEGRVSPPQERGPRFSNTRNTPGV